MVFPEPDEHRCVIVGLEDTDTLLDETVEPDCGRRGLESKHIINRSRE